MDLWDEGQRHGAFIHLDWGPDGLVIFRRRDVADAWSAARPRVARLLATVKDVGAVLQQARAQFEDEWAMSLHDPRPVYVAAFTEAHRGREYEARELRARDETLVADAVAGERGERWEQANRALERVLLHAGRS